MDPKQEELEDIMSKLHMTIGYFYLWGESARGLEIQQLHRRLEALRDQLFPKVTDAD